jgi:hypothetical protein
MPKPSTRTPRRFGRIWIAIAAIFGAFLVVFIVGLVADVPIAMALGIEGAMVTGIVAAIIAALAAVVGFRFRESTPANPSRR